MSRQIVISDLSGSTFYNIWDDRSSSNEIAISVGNIDDSVPDQPYTITLPSSFDNTDTFGIHLLNGKFVVMEGVFDENRGGISIPTPIVSLTPSVTQTPSNTVTPSVTQTPSVTPTPTISQALQGAILESCCQSGTYYNNAVNIPDTFNTGDSITFNGEHSSVENCYFIHSVYPSNPAYEIITVINHYPNDVDCEQCLSSEPCPSPSLTPTQTITPTTTPTPTPTPTSLENLFTFLSGVSSNSVYMIKDLPQSLNIGDTVSGETNMYYYSKTGYVSNILEWNLLNRNDVDTQIRSFNYNGNSIKNQETIFKVVSYSDIQSNKYAPSLINSTFLIPTIDSLGNTNYPTFTTISNDETEVLTPFSGTVRIRIDIPKKVADYSTSYETINNRFNLIADQIEEIYNVNSTLPFDISIDVFVNSGTTVFDDMSLSDYINYYENLGGILSATTYHKGLLVSGTKNTSKIGGFYCCVAGTSFNANSSQTVFSTMAHEIGHTFGLQHLFSRYFKNYSYNNKPEDVYVIDGFSTNSATPFLDNTVPGDFCPYSAVTGFRPAVMSYATVPNYALGSFSYSWASIMDTPRVGYVKRSNDITNSYFSTKQGNYDRVNVSYYDIVDSEYAPNTIDKIELNFDYAATTYNGSTYDFDTNVNFTSGITTNHINVGNFNNTNTTLTSRVAGRPETFSSFTYTLSGTELNSVFDYSNQSEFSVEFTTDFNTGNQSVFWFKNLTLTFTDNLGESVVLKPKNYLTKRYTDSTFTDILQTYRCTDTGFFDYDGLIDIEVDFMTLNAIINKNYYSL